jgi:ribose 1,5-bisphosphokinase
MTGQLILVVGPSGVGKDSLIDAARLCLENNTQVYFPRRYITRSFAAGGENHIEVSLDQFREMQSAKAFCLHWGAHELYYGIPGSIRLRLEQGQNVIVNGSRSVINQARRQFDNLLIASITANENCLRERLNNRGRETEMQIEARIRRSTSFTVKGNDVIEIDNSGTLATAAVQLIDIARSQLPSKNLEQVRTALKA